MFLCVCFLCDLNTGELIGVEYLYSQTGRVLQDTAMDENAVPEVDKKQDDADEGFSEADDPTVADADIVIPSANSLSTSKIVTSKPATSTLAYDCRQQNRPSRRNEWLLCDLLIFCWLFDWFRFYSLSCVFISALHLYFQITFGFATGLIEPCVSTEESDTSRDTSGSWRPSALPESVLVVPAESDPDVRPLLARSFLRQFYS